MKKCFFYVISLMSTLSISAMLINTPQHHHYIVYQEGASGYFAQGHLFSVNGTIPQNLPQRYTIIPTVPLKSEKTDIYEQTIDYALTHGTLVLLFCPLTTKDLTKKFQNNIFRLSDSLGRMQPNTPTIFVSTYEQKEPLCSLHEQQSIPQPYAIYAENVKKHFLEMLLQQKYSTYTHAWTKYEGENAPYNMYTTCALDDLLIEKKHKIILYLTMKSLFFTYNNAEACHHPTHLGREINYIAQQALQKICTIISNNSDSQNNTIPCVLIVPEKNKTIYKMQMTRDQDNKANSYTLSALEEKHSNDETLTNHRPIVLIADLRNEKHYSLIHLAAKKNIPIFAIVDKKLIKSEKQLETIDMIIKNIESEKLINLSDHPLKKEQSVKHEEDISGPHRRYSFTTPHIFLGGSLMLLLAGFLYSYYTK